MKIKFGESLDSTKNIDLALPHPIVFKTVEEGDRILIDDGYIQGIVKKVMKKSIEVQFTNSGLIKDRKGVNIPGKYIDLPSLIKSDLKQLDMAAMNKVDFIALSFVRTANDVKTLKNEMEKRKVNAQIVSKIESQPALDHIDEIIASSDAVMVARGDLGIEVPIEELAYWQKEIITRCRKADKPVITATQMLESMIKNPLPSRAEATDVANAVLDGSDALMLSAETAAGEYPIKSVEQMAKIAAFNEGKIELCEDIIALKPKNSTEQITSAAVDIVRNQISEKIQHIVIFTETGYTAKTFSSYRLNIPVIAVTDSDKTVETLTLSYGIYPFYTQFPEGKVIPERIIKRLVDKDVLQPDETILLIHGKNWGVPGLTNSLSILKV